ncbi:hypothetical protein GIB67_038210 [Kingdonia uniflora]|uniref:Uncharacterized protein n=1 Tax=Kingdonia uniflora TaxID=39325 RepID=A0A7J7NHC2_9MAGN|nr:hypothetical protein GIB67_038210 [Kingdonia uniflora]
MLRCNEDEILLFFPVGENSDLVGFVKLSKRKFKIPVVIADTGGDVFRAEESLNSRILQISVTSGGGGSGKSFVVGFLLASTLYSVDWFRVEISNPGSDLERPVLVHLGKRHFSHIVVHSCWNPHWAKESLVLLKNGELFLFHLESIAAIDKLPVKLEGTKVSVAWEGCKEGGWLSCDFSWHPRIFIVACFNVVYMVDWRLENSSGISVLANIEMFDLNHLVRNDRFIAFCKAGSDGFRFCVVTEYHLCLLDIRKPLMPALQWVHHLNNPRYINVFKLSELRTNSTEEQYKWASESGFAILLGSFWDCEFNLFCYGPSLPTPYGSVASRVSSFCNSLYAWELPSELCLLGNRCNCGNCLLKEDCYKTMLPEWIDWRQKEELVLGFCIISGDTWDCSEGFTLIRLVTSGRLELQRYFASWDFISVKPEESRKRLSSQIEDSRLRAVSNQKYKFPRRFKYLRLEYLHGYIYGDLSNVLIKKMQNIPSRTISPTQDRRELISEMLRSVGVHQVGSSPDLANVFSEIGSPMSIREIGSSRMWAGLPLDLLQMAFSNYAELAEVLLDQKKIGIQFLDVPNSSQFPLFFLRKPCNLSNKLPQNVQQGDGLVGPVLPLPLLLTFDDFDMGNHNSDLEENGYSSDYRLTHQCNEVLEVANVSLESCCDINGNHNVSLADERKEKMECTKESRTLFFYKPGAFSDQQDEPFVEDKTFSTFLSKVHEKKSTSISMKKRFGLEAFDDLCPVQVKFTPLSREKDSLVDSSPIEFSSEEMTQYNKLRNQFLLWQKDLKPYQDFCKAIQK